MKRIAKELVLLLTFLLLCAIYGAPMVKAAESSDTLDSPEPLMVSWYVEVDGRRLYIYYATDPDGLFTLVPAGGAGEDPRVLDYIATGGAGTAGTYQNPIRSGYWNPDKPEGYAVCDLHITAVSNYYFYVDITNGGGTQHIAYWPTETSVKPIADEDGNIIRLDMLQVPAAGSPSGYAWPGNGLGNGPTTAYPTIGPPPPVIPEVPFGTIVTFLSLFTVLIGFVGVKRFRAKSH